ncbi:helix-turn-helix domain-containing protein [Janthinobacterium sp. UMAB-56]|uniref:helix-turn-helix domain-containing protein n=1 Tax=Janthinobacterium sp. UMAB-56 TaxID=1365361 RepID=UPI00214C77FE|nr:helix-turn-helix transcriptional regulator [Janthinobacterium sp. UMAB-56]
MREIIGVRLKAERERLGYNQADFAAVGGASKRTQIDWEQGKQVPNAEFLAAVSAIGVDVLYVVTGQFTPGNLSADESEVVAGYRKMDIRGKAGVLGLIGGMNQPQNLVQPVHHGDIGQNIYGDITGPNTVKMPDKRKKKPI